MCGKLRVLCALFIVAFVCVEGSEDIQRLVEEKKYGELGRYVKRRLGSTVTLSELHNIAVKQKSKSLLRASLATKNFKKIKSDLGVSTGAFFQIALFIETDLKKYIAHNRNFLPKSVTKLSNAIEHDPKGKRTFIVLDHSKKNFIGEGAVKTVYKSILYHPKMPEVVARGEQSRAIKREIQITRLLQGSSGIFSIKGFGKHKEHGKEKIAIYSKLYHPGALQTAFEKGEKFSLYEKMSIALNILKGLDALHSRHIVHRDLGARNYLIDIPHGKAGKRKIVAGIADLERANFSREVADTKVQGNTKYTAPEGLFRSQMKGSDYYASDVYAVGLVFYRLFYGKIPVWQDTSYVKEVFGNVSFRHKQLVCRIERATGARKNHLARKASWGKISKKEAFEYMILRMVDPNPKKRGTAKELRAKMERLISAK